MTKTQNHSSQSVGTLWVVATPLGHLDDLSGRARATLSQVAIVAAEDTRTTRRLVEPAPNQRWLSVNEHSESGRVGELIAALLSGQDVALVSDAGTPLISDPGYRLVAAAHEQGIRVAPVPGPSAAVAALSVSGLPCDRFFFEGFLPAKPQARRNRLTALAEYPSTWIVYVPARDLEAVLDDMVSVMGPDRPIALAREMTKQFETIRRATVADLQKWLQSDPEQRLGEAVCVVQGNDAPVTEISANTLAKALRGVLPPSQAARLLAGVSGLSRQQAWAAIEGTASQDQAWSKDATES